MTTTLHTLALPAFRTPIYLANPHVQTIIPKIVKQSTPKFERELFPDSTGTTQVAFDFIYNKKRKHTAQNPIAVMFHGLEGSSESHYAQAFANYASEHGWDAVVVHYRGCGGIENTAEVDYNAGDTAEAHHIFTQLKSRYDVIVATGVSLGGNLLARYMGEYGDNALCAGAAVVSAPVDLATSAKAMHKFVARQVYTPYLLKPLLTKALKKIQDPELVTALKNIKTIDQFDELYTGPRHGYGSAAGYYRNASALPVLKDITKPTLIISAKDDPFLGIMAKVQDVSPAVRLMYSEHGGHVGFVRPSHKQLSLTWLPATTYKFFDWVVEQIAV